MRQWTFLLFRGHCSGRNFHAHAVYRALLKCYRPPALFKGNARKQTRQKIVLVTILVQACQFYLPRVATHFLHKLIDIVFRYAGNWRAFARTFNASRTYWIEKIADCNVRAIEFVHGVPRIPLLLYTLSCSRCSEACL